MTRIVVVDNHGQFTHLFGGRLVVDDVGVDPEVPKRPALEVCELSVVVDHDDARHRVFVPRRRIKSV